MRVKWKSDALVILKFHFLHWLIINFVTILLLVSFMLFMLFTNEIVAETINKITTLLAIYMIDNRLKCFFDAASIRYAVS